MRATGGLYLRVDRTQGQRALWPRRSQGERARTKAACARKGCCFEEGSAPFLFRAHDGQNRVMNYRERFAAAGRFRAQRWVAVGALCLCAFLLLLGLTSSWHRPIVETITTEEVSHTHAQPGPAVQFTPQLPQRDADVEAAGDHLAAAAVYLKNRQSAQALRSITQARTATTHAIERRRQDGKRFDVLDETLRAIDSAERFIQRGALGEARAHLIAVNKRLDDSLER